MKKIPSQLSVISRCVRSKTHPKLLKLLSAMVIFWLGIAQANGTVVFQDDFSRDNSNDPGGIWQSFEADDNDIAIYNQRLRLRDYLSQGTTHASFFLDAGDYKDLSLSFSWQALSSTEKSDSLTISGDPFANIQGQTLFVTDLGTAGRFSSSISLTDSFRGWIGFWLGVNSASESVYIDDIVVHGTALTVTSDTVPVNEASSAVLIGLGFIGLTFIRRRHQKPEGTKPASGRCHTENNIHT